MALSNPQDSGPTISADLPTGLSTPDLGVVTATASAKGFTYLATLWGSKNYDDVFKSQTIRVPYMGEARSFDDVWADLTGDEEGQPGEASEDMATEMKVEMEIATDNCS